jgi:hypothetical protein
VACPWCLDFFVREENELSRHFSAASPASIFSAPCAAAHAAAGPPPPAAGLGRSTTRYDLCWAIPARVAAALSSTAGGDVALLRGWDAAGWTGVNWVPKSPVASPAQMAQLFVAKGMAVPGWVALEGRLSLMELDENGELVDW